MDLLPNTNGRLIASKLVEIKRIHKKSNSFDFQMKMFEFQMIIFDFQMDHSNLKWNVYEFQLKVYEFQMETLQTSIGKFWNSISNESFEFLLKFYETNEILQITPIWCSPLTKSYCSGDRTIWIEIKLHTKDFQHYIQRTWRYIFLTYVYNFFSRALINLDSTGSGGKEVLFQTGPNHPWLIKVCHRSK